MNAAWYLSKSVVRIIVMEFRIIVSVIYAEIFYQIHLQKRNM